MARLNKELQDINIYYKNLEASVDIGKIGKTRIQKVDKGIYKYFGVKSIKPAPKKPKSSDVLRVTFVFVLFYDLFRVGCTVLMALIFRPYLFRLFCNVGGVPDKVGVGLSSYDKEGKRLNESLLRVVEERIATNETVSKVYLSLIHI